jgi:hypothetical protein
VSVPLFVALKRCWWEQYRDGTKRVEWRVYGPRWNCRVAWKGRPVTLSLGYSGPRIAAEVVRTRKVPRALAPEKARQFYPDATHFCAILVSVSGPPTYS